MWPCIHKVCRLLHIENEEALLGAVLCIPSPETFNDNNPSFTLEAAYGDLQSTRITVDALAVMEKGSSEKCLLFESYLSRSVSNFETYPTSQPSVTEQLVTFNHSTLFVEWMSTLRPRCVSKFDLNTTHPSICMYIYITAPQVMSTCV